MPEENVSNEAAQESEEAQAAQAADGGAQGFENSDAGGAGENDGMADETAAGAEDEAPVDDEELEELRDNEAAFRWEASEYVHHHKSAGWFLALGGIVAVLIGLSVWTKSWLAIGLYVAGGAAVVVYAVKPPKTMMYEVTPKGVQIESKAYPYGNFRSFGVMPDEDWHAIDLEPAGRFSPRLTILFNSDDFDEIVSHLELHLPRIDREPDMVEKVTRFVRF